MRLVLDRGQEDELLDSVIFPPSQQLVQGSVESLAPKARLTCIGLPARGNHPVPDRWCQQDSAPFRDLLRNGLRNDRVGSQGKVRAMLMERAHWEDEPGISGKKLPRVRPGKVTQAV